MVRKMICRTVFLCFCEGFRKITINLMSSEQRNLWVWGKRDKTLCKTVVSRFLFVLSLFAIHSPRCWLDLRVTGTSPHCRTYGVPKVVQLQGLGKGWENHGKPRHVAKQYGGIGGGSMENGRVLWDIHRSGVCLKRADEAFHGEHHD